MFYRLYIATIAFVFILLPTVVFGQDEVVGYYLGEKDGMTHLTLSVSNRVSYKVFQLSNPSRLVVDLKNVRRGGAFPVGKTLDRPPVNKIRSGIQNGVDLRIVLDLSAPATAISSGLVASGNGSRFYTLTVNFSTKGGVSRAQTITRAPAQTHTQAPAKPAVSPPTQQERPQVIATSPATPSFQPVPRTKPSGTSEAKADDSQIITPKAQTPTEADLKEGKPLIILDAGHGGTDPGTQGYAGTFEKHITLAYALALKEALEKTGKYRVMLTRAQDVYVDLKERVRKAKLVNGDLFLSLHADSHPDKQMRGLSVYTLSETASDKEAAALAAKENKSDAIYDVNLDTENPEIAGILIDIIQRENANASALVAESLIKELDQEVTLLRYPHRFAGFRVLTAPDIPSLLVELGYLSNPEEEGLLNSPQYKKKMVNAIVRSIDNYFKDRMNI